MSNVDAPNVNADGEITNEELLVEQSGIPAMTKKFTIETDTQILGDLDVTGTVTATSFIGDGSQLTGISGGGGPQSELVSGESFVKFDVADPQGDSAAPANPKLLSTGGVDLWDVEINTLNDFIVDVGDDIGLTAGDDVDISAAENVNITSVDYMDIISEDNIYLTAEGKIDLETSDYIELDGDTYIKTGHPLRLQDDFDGVNPGMESFVQDLDGATSTEVPSAAAVKSVTDDIQSQIDNLGTGGGLDSAGVQTVFDNQQSIRLGEGATTQDASGEVAIGYNADATGADAIAIGYDANATALFTLSLGRGSNATYEDAIAIGRSATSSQADTIAMGTSAVASSSRSVAIGNGADATGTSSVALGNSAQALSTNAIAIGLSADTNTNTDGIAIGSNTEVKGAQGISIGQNAEASASSVAIGTNSSITTGTETTAVGPFAGGTGSASLALGRGAKANANNTIVLAATGGNSAVATQYGIDIRTSAAGSLTYNTTNDWTFGAGVTMTDLTASGATVVFSNLPTTDPLNAGQLWNDLGTLKISAG
jgi:hypothetical protein